VARKKNKLYPCPYEITSKCDLSLPCRGCETSDQAALVRALCRCENRAKLDLLADMIRSGSICDRDYNKLALNIINKLKRSICGTKNNTD